MSLAQWMRLQRRLRPWMVMVAFAAPAVAGGCKKAAPAGAADDTAAAAEACAPAVFYGPAPSCTTDEACAEQHGPGWVCAVGANELDDGCGNKVQWPTGACSQAAEASDAAPAAETTEPHAVDDTDADAAAVDVGEDDETDTGEAGTEEAADATPAEMAQRVRDAVAAGPLESVEPRLPSVYAVPDYGIPTTTPSARVTLNGTPSLGGDGTIDPTIVARKVRQALPGVRSCYQRALEDDRDLAGTLGFEAAVSESGTVRVSVTSADAGLQSAGVTNCVLAGMRQVSFAETPPQAGEVRVRFSLSFQPGSQ